MPDASIMRVPSKRGSRTGVLFVPTVSIRPPAGRLVGLRRTLVRARSAGEPGALLHDERLLVTPAWLAARTEDVRILDARGTVRKVARTEDGGGKYYQQVEYAALRDDYLDFHIPGAVFVDWTRDVVDPDSGALYNLKAPEAFIETMEEKGVSEDRTVVVYDRGDMLYAARLWYALAMYGHPDVRVLDGGWARWNEEDLPTDSDEPCPLKIYATFAPEGLTSSMLVSLADVVGRDDDTLLIDARSAKQYDGTERRAARGGHIPGAINVDRRRLMNENGVGFLPPAELRAVFNESGVDLARPIIAYCNGGVASAAVIFALHLLGVPFSQLSNYDGSWNEYGSDAQFPVATT